MAVFYVGSSGTGVDVEVDLENNEIRVVHVDQGAQLPESVDGKKVTAATRKRLLEQATWSAQSSSKTQHKEA